MQWNQDHDDLGSHDDDHEETRDDDHLGSHHVHFHFYEEGEVDPQKADAVYGAIFGVQLAQVIGSNPFDGLRVYGIVLEPDIEPIYLTEEAAERLVLMLQEAFQRSQDL